MGMVLGSLDWLKVVSFLFIGALSLLLPVLGYESSIPKTFSRALLMLLISIGLGILNSVLITAIGFGLMAESGGNSLFTVLAWGVAITYFLGLVFFFNDLKTLRRSS